MMSDWLFFSLWRELLYEKTNKLGLALESFTLFVGLYVFIELNLRIKKQDYLFF